MPARHARQPRCTPPRAWAHNGAGSSPGRHDGITDAPLKVIASSLPARLVAVPAIAAVKGADLTSLVTDQTVQSGVPAMHARPPRDRSPSHGRTMKGNHLPAIASVTGSFYRGEVKGQTASPMSYKSFSSVRVPGRSLPELLQVG